MLPFGHDLVNGIGQFRFVRKHAEEGISWPYAWRNSTMPDKVPKPLFDTQAFGLRQRAGACEILVVKSDCNLRHVCLPCRLCYGYTTQARTVVGRRWLWKVGRPAQSSTAREPRAGILSMRECECRCRIRGQRLMWHVPYTPQPAWFAISGPTCVGGQSRALCSEKDYARAEGGAVRLLDIADHGGFDRFGDNHAGADRARRRRHLLERAAPDGGRTGRRGAAESGRAHDGRDAGTLQRAHPRARVWGRRVRRRGRHCLFFQLRRSAPLSPGSRCDVTAA